MLLLWVKKSEKEKLETILAPRRKRHHQSSLATTAPDTTKGLRVGPDSGRGSHGAERAKLLQQAQGILWSRIGLRQDTDTGLHQNLRLGHTR